VTFSIDIAHESNKSTQSAHSHNVRRAKKGKLKDHQATPIERERKS